MIKKDEIEAKSEEFEIHTSDVQRDYVFGWVLFGLYSGSSLKDMLILKGGNAFRKAYFPSTRFSEDLDFTTSQGINGQNLLNEFNSICKFIKDNAGIEFEIEKNRIADSHSIDNKKQVYKLRLYFKDFYGNESKMTISVRLDITEFDRIYLPTQNRALIHPYSDSEDCNIEISTIKLEEALADKLKCLIQRRSSFDLFDIVYSIFVNNVLEVDKKEIVTTFLKKTIFESSPITAKQLLLDTPISLFKEYWNSHIVCPKEGRFDFEEAEEQYSSIIEDLFADFSYSRASIRAFYPSDMRYKILDAGRTMTMMKILYHGRERLIEPYSLAYKRRKKDGVSQEYFYAYDTTGGNSGPGIKVFLNTDITSLENTDQKFEPRYEVEVSKAGEVAKKSYFSSSFRGGRGPSSFTTGSSRRTGKQPTYVLKCSYCGKEFKRYTYKISTSLRKHKNLYGSDCYGRNGYIVK